MIIDILFWIVVAVPFIGGFVYIVLPEFSDKVEEWIYGRDR